VHFLRFKLGAAMVADLKDDANLRAGIDHPHYPNVDFLVPKSIRDSLLHDLD